METNSDRSKQLYRDIFNNAPLGIYTLDSTGTISSFNPKMAELSGDVPQDAIGLNVFKMDSYKKAGLDTFFAKGLAGEAFETEVSYTSFLGKKTSIRHYRGVPIKGDHSPGHARLLLIVEDVTEKRRTEKRLRASVRVEKLERERLIALVNNMGDAVIATDRNGDVILYNAAALDLLNTNETIKNKPINAYLRTYTKDKKPIDIVELARSTGRMVRRDDLLFRVDDDEYMNVYLDIAPVHLGYGHRGEEGFVMLLRDITKQKSIEEQRDEFIAVVSHELRTPIAIVEATISTSMLPKVQSHPKKVLDLLKQAHKNTVFLANLVNDITTLAHVERGQLEAPLERVDPATIVRELAAFFLPQVQKKRLELKIDIGLSVPSVESNAQRLKEILDNFITNAIKYTEKGSITLRVNVANRKHVRFSVTDTGIGLSKSDQKKVFDKFWRSEDYRTREHTGTGLGLYISKKLAERMNGVITLESKRQHGSTFSLTIPLKFDK